MNGGHLRITCTIVPLCCLGFVTLREVAASAAAL
jgi:hypothetical protein